MTPYERFDAYDDLGGRAPVELSVGSESAMYDAGLGNPDMRRRVEARRRGEAVAQKAEQDAAQRIVNQAGATAIRAADVARDAANGVDINSTEYLLKQRIAERARTRRA